MQHAASSHRVVKDGKLLNSLPRTEVLDFSFPLISQNLRMFRDIRARMTWRHRLLQGLPVDSGVHLLRCLFLGRGGLASRESQGDLGSKEVKSHRPNPALSFHRNGNQECQGPWWQRWEREARFSGFPNPHGWSEKLPFPLIQRHR